MSGCELNSFDGFWRQRCGIDASSTIAISHANILTVLYSMQSYDQYDLSNSASGEYPCRWALVIQAATRRNPKAPDFSNLDAFLARCLDSYGGIQTSDFTKFIADEQKAEAVVMKQHRI